MISRTLELRRHSHRHWTAACAVAAGLACAIGACSDSTPTTPAQPVVNNTAPTIESIAVSSARVDAGQEVQLTASVKDAETPLDQLTYTWSASPVSGTFTGSGAVVKWRAPMQQATPALYLLTLTVTEKYTSSGQTRENTVSSTASVHYNDSPAEVAHLGIDFLVDKFANFNVSPAQAVSNFSDSCKGKADELGDVTENRANFHILSGTFTPTSVAFNSGLTTGTVDGPCAFEDIPNSGPNAGRKERVSGTCHLTTVYENFRWFLCVSNFEPPYDVALLSLKGRVPGRVVFQQNNTF